MWVVGAPGYRCLYCLPNYPRFVLSVIWLTISGTISGNVFMEQKSMNLVESVGNIFDFFWVPYANPDYSSNSSNSYPEHRYANNRPPGGSSDESAPFVFFLSWLIMCITQLLHIYIYIYMFFYIYIYIQIIMYICRHILANPLKVDKPITQSWDTSRFGEKIRTYVAMLNGDEIFHMEVS